MKTPLFFLVTLWVTLFHTELLSQTITPTQTDALILDNGQPAEADPGDRIRYTVTITESGGTTPGNNVTMQVTPDVLTTFVPGSFRSSPLAIADAYACTGNVGIQVPAGSGLLINDFDDNIAGLTATAVVNAATTMGGQITVSTDGSFTYIPPAGFNGADSYTYTLNDGNPVGGPVPSTDMGVVTFNVSNRIYFIDNSSVAATSDGRRNSPYKTLADFNSGSTNAADIIYIEHTGTNYTGGIVLANNERLFGEGHSGAANLSGVLNFTLAMHSLGLPNINGSRPVITNAAGTGVAVAMNNHLRGFDVGNTPAANAGINGNGIGTLTVSEVSVTGTGQILSLNDGILNATFGGLSTTSTTQTAMVLSNLSGSISDTDAGNSSISGASGVFSITAVASTTIALTFNGDVTHSGANPLLLIQNHNTGLVTFQNGTLSSTTGGIGFTNSDAMYHFNGTTILSGTSRIVIDGGSSGTFHFNNNTSVTNPSNVAFELNGSSAVVDYNGTLSSNTAFRLIDIANNTGGSANFDGNLTFTGNATGIRVQSNTGGTYSFNGSGKSFTSGTNTGINLASNTGATINFTNGGLVITTTSGTGFNATGGGTVTVQGTGNTISSGTGTALNVANTTIGASNMTFQSISHNGGTNGIVLNTTGSSGGLTVTGTGGPGSGGTIQNAAIGVNMTSTRNISFTRMQLNDFTDYAVRGTSVFNFTMDNTVISGTNGNDAAADEGSVRFTDLTGSASITNCNISGAVENNFRVVNSTGTLDRITFNGSTFGPMSPVTGNDGLVLESLGSAVIKVTVQNSFFTHAAGDLFNFLNNGTATNDLIFTGNTLTNNHLAIATGGGGVTISGGDLGGSMTFNIATNSFRDADGHAILIVKSTGTGTYSGTFSNNTVGVVAVANSGSIAGSGLKVQNAGQGNVTIAITNNQIRQYNNFGIELLTGGGAMAQSGNLHATVTGNTVSNPGTGGLPMNGIHLNGGTVPGDTYSICTHISGNTITGSGANAGTDFRLRQRQSTTVRLPGYGGANNNDAAVVTFVSGNNGGASGLASNTVPTGGGFVGGAACNTP